MKRAWAVALVGGLAIAGTALGLAMKPRRRRLGESLELDPEDAKHWGPVKLHDIEARARAAGARGKLSYVGAGAEGFVVCDDRDKAYKAAWRGHGASSGLEDEARWFQMAAKIPSIKQHVPTFARYNAEEDVLVRECVKPRKLGRDESRPRPNSKRLWDLHQRLTAVMAPYGYGRPEFKNDAYVYSKRGPVLVDAGFAINRGGQLVKEAQRLLKQEHIKPHDAEDAAFALRMERGGTVPAPIANKLLARLKARDPKIDVD